MRKFEKLEQRICPAYTVANDGGVLKITDTDNGNNVVNIQYLLEGGVHKFEVLEGEDVKGTFKAADINSFDIKMGNGNDRIDLTHVTEAYGFASTMSVVADLKDGADSYHGSAFRDEVYLGMGSNSAWGGAGDDVIVGGDSVDKIDGESGGDELYGNGGVDTIKGDSGSDLIAGGLQNDLIEGGADQDFIYGDIPYDPASGGDDSSTAAAATIRFTGAVEMISSLAVADITFSLEMMAAMKFGAGTIQTSFSWSRAMLFGL